MNLILSVIISGIFSLVSVNNDLKINKKAPMVEYQMKGVDEKNHSLNSSVKKNGLIVVFTCNTCPFVVGSEKFPGWEIQYNEISKLAKDNNIGLLFVNSNEAKRNDADSFEEMKKRSQNKAYQHPYVMDNNHQLADAFGAKTTPHVFAFSSDLKLVYKGSIDNSYDNNRKDDEKYLTAAISYLGKKVKKINNQVTPPRGCSIKRVSK